MVYDAFISYSHAADGELAPALQSGLQKLARPWYRPRALRVFRDETGLSTNPHLWTSITEALDGSEWFVLLASPEAAASEWVDREIAHWLATKPASRILPVVTGGEWTWDVTAGRLSGDAVPERLAAAITEEPRHLDLRWAADASDLDLRDPRFRSAIADLAAPVHGIAKDELVGEDLRQHRRARRLARAGVATIAVLLVVAVVFGFYAVGQRDDARAATETARQRLLVSQSQANLSSDRQLATLLAIEADRRHPGPETRDAALNAVFAEPALQRTFAGPVSAMGLLSGDRVVVLRRDAATLPADRLQVWNWRTGRRVLGPDAPRGRAAARPVGLASTADGELLAVLRADGTVQFYRGENLAPEGSPVVTGLGGRARPVDTVRLSADGRTFAVWGSTPSFEQSDDQAVAVFTRLGSGWFRAPGPHGHRTTVNALDLSADGTVLVTVSAAPRSDDVVRTDVVVSSVATGETVQAFPTPRRAKAVALDWTRRRVVIAEGNLDVNAEPVAYELGAGPPRSHALPIGVDVVGRAAVMGYDAARDRLGVMGPGGFVILDGATLTRSASAPVLRPATPAGPFVFADSEHVLLGTYGATGPISAWDLTGTSVLVRRPPAGIDDLRPGGDPRYLLGIGYPSTGGSQLTVVRPDLGRVGDAIPVERTQTVCQHARTHRIAVVSNGRATVSVRSGAPPFRELAGGSTTLTGSNVCTWRPDGRVIAIGTFPIEGSVASVALYDVATARLRTIPFPRAVAVTSLQYSPESNVLWVAVTGSGALGGTGLGAFRITEHHGSVRVRRVSRAASGVALSSDGRRIAVTDRDGLTVRDARSLAPVGRRIPLPGADVYGVSYLPGGTEAVVSTLGGWQLVDLGSGQSVGPRVPISQPAWVWVGARGTQIYSLLPDGEAGGAAVWNVGARHVREVACTLAGRNLTAREWKRYLDWAGPRRATCPQFASG